MPNITKAIDALRHEERQLAEALSKVRGAIAALSGGTGTTGSGRARAANTTRSGRTMTAAQRTAVSRRMKAYWANRKKATKK